MVGRCSCSGVPFIPFYSIPFFCILFRGTKYLTHSLFYFFGPLDSPNTFNIITQKSDLSFLVFPQIGGEVYHVTGEVESEGGASFLHCSVDGVESRPKLVILDNVVHLFSMVRPHASNTPSGGPAEHLLDLEAPEATYPVLVLCF